MEVGIFYLYLVRFDRAENSTTTHLDVISVHCVKRHSRTEMSSTYIRTVCGNLYEVGEMAVMSISFHAINKEWKCMEISRADVSVKSRETSRER